MSIPVVSFLPYLVLAIIGFCIGLFIAWILWKNSRGEAEKIERENKKLEADHDALEREIAELEAGAA